MKQQQIPPFSQPPHISHPVAVPHSSTVTAAAAAATKVSHFPSALTPHSSAVASEPPTIIQPPAISIESHVSVCVCVCVCVCVYACLLGDFYASGIMFLCFRSHQECLKQMAATTTKIATNGS